MKYLSLELTALSPVAIRADHAPSGVASSPYIAGTTLAGSLASLYRQYYGEQNNDFTQLFLSGLVHYPNLYPATPKHEAVREKVEQANNPVYSPVYPLPKTAQSCKRFSGFALDNADEERHGTHDTLFDWAVFQLGKQTTTALQPLQKYKACKKCHKAMQQFRGYYRQVSSHETGALTAETGVHTRLQTHTGIDRATGTVQEGILYSREVFEEGSCFQGVIILPDDDKLAHTLTTFIQQVRQSGLVRVGTGRTRGMGKVELDITPLEAKSFGFGRFSERLENFNLTLRTALHDANIAIEPASFYFALTLHAPAILRDSLLRYRGSITATALADILAILRMQEGPRTPFECIYQAASVQRVTGWNDLWGTPRTQEIAIESGSVFLFALKADEARHELYEALFRLENEGVGERRAEGFGRVCVSDPFHQTYAITEEGLR
ncbi:MAG TPA: RAMP superfamily CRISPR-associated protein [Ktedonobacteraceae bacterium]